MDNTELTVIIGVVGKALGLELVPSYHESDPPRLKGNGFFVNIKTNWRKDNRLEVSAYLANDLVNHRPVRDEYPRDITLSAAKSLPQITKEIKTRLLDVFMPLVKICQDHQTNDNRERSQRAAFLNDIERSLGQHSRKDRPPAYNTNQEPEEVEIPYDLSPRVRVKSNYDGTSADIRIEPVSRDEALMLCEILRQRYSLTWDRQRGAKIRREAA